MEKTLHNILGEIRRTNAPLAPDALDRIIRARNREVAGPVRYVAKKKLLPFYQEAKEHRPEHWRTWGVSPAEEALLVRTLQVKPRRTASGVATVTVLTKPWPCSSACLYCPNDVRMPKSYLHDEPACQRAERNWFDPYLQVTARLRTLHQMGHVTDKVELIVLGGTWSDYPEAYQIWYMHELFRALNDMGCETAVERESETRRKQYRDAGIACERDDLANWAAEAQARVTAGDASYNETVRNLYACGTHVDGNGWVAAAQWQTATFPQLEALQRKNESTEHRCVGLVVETRPDAVTPKRLAMLRRLGCTKLQMGIQSLDERILAANHRGIGVDRMQQAFEFARIFGFKTHAHFMTNLLGATPEGDAADYRRMVEHPAFKPDEVKLYPCALVDGTGLVAHWRDGSWRPYTEQELVNLLAEDVLVTPPFTRISRMIRDISAHDIMTGNKKVNLRQLVDLELAKRSEPVQEIRSREIAFGAAANDELSLSEVAYETTNTHEVFLQWVAPGNRIAGFLRLSMPNADYIDAHVTALPIDAGEAMIREVHVYGRVAGLHQGGENAQHRGLGRMLIERACDIARENGYTAINVISAIGTRGYYRKQGFTDNGLYQQRSL
ncbi:elongator complex protein 3 [Senegalimassilia anaerobia]|uniref:tRNA carboxymethyluridine synthase n=1 Tax=Senegalimassilia anaerobia TaxID=1473216 RepID=A0A369L9X1_9ACTN|nr:tRNA uridine(34) 5-carboxymethylaminomethyl modification radical SAM/GNAT enzyme Elp3 [Senegalimassilia anaerobia]RDB55006.1 histone acetyltransferase [Senegalimassilia anaerobia]